MTDVSHVIKVACVHPSYGRPRQAIDTVLKWLEQAEHAYQVEYLLCVDDNDPDLQEYQALLEQAHTKQKLLLFGRFVLNVSPSRNVVQAINAGGKLLSSTTELIVGTADDMDSISNWDTQLLSQLIGVDNFNTPKLIGVSDGLRGYGEVMVYLIVNRAWYTRLGYLICPEYDGVFADNDMHQVALRLNALVNAPHLVFQHRHYIIGLNPMDATYARNNNQAGWDRNHAVYQGRAGRNFDL